MAAEPSARPRRSPEEAASGPVGDLGARDSEGLPLWALIILVPVLPVLLPLLIFEGLVLFFTDVALFPLKSACVNTTPIKGTFDISKMPPPKGVRPEVLAKTRETMVRRCFRAKAFHVVEGETEEMVKATCTMMLQENTVSSTAWCPEDLTGVFWMKGNTAAEELACLSYSVDTAVEGAVATTRPNGHFGWAYLDSWLGKYLARRNPIMGTTGMIYFVFSTSALAHGRVYGCSGYNYEELGCFFRLINCTMERTAGDGVAWKRGCYWLPGWFGKRLEMGSYTLTKIMGTDGEPVQPAYGEFVERMATTNKGLRLMLAGPSRGR